MLNLVSTKNIKQKEKNKNKKSILKYAFIKFSLQWIRAIFFFPLFKRHRGETLRWNHSVHHFSFAIVHVAEKKTARWREKINQNKAAA